MCPESNSASILSINSYHYVRGGADAVYFQHASLFESRGWRSSFFSMHHDKNLPCKDSSYFAENIDYSDLGSPLKAISDAAKIIYSVEAAAKLRALLDTRRVDVAHVHNIYHHLSPSVLRELRRRNIPTVMTAHDLKLACPNNKMMNRTGVCERCKRGKLWNVIAYKCVKDRVVPSALVAVESAVHKSLNLYARYLDRIIAPSHFYKQKLVEWGWDASQIVYIPNFVEFSRPAAAGDSGYMLYFGRLAPEKGLETLVRAAARAQVRVKIAGTGPSSDHLKHVAASVSAPVEFTGFIAGKDLERMIDQCRAVVLPSEWYENAPMSVIEAFARGKPVIGARIGGIPELILEGDTGWSFEAGSVDALAELLSDVMNCDMTSLCRMSSATFEFGRENFSPDVYWRRMIALYAELGVFRQ